MPKRFGFIVVCRGAVLPPGGQAEPGAGSWRSRGLKNESAASTINRRGSR
jgi:hypothetical protein